MNKIIFILIVISLARCDGKNSQYNQYKQIITRADTIQLRDIRAAKLLMLSNQDFKTFKEVLLRNINHETQKPIKGNKYIILIEKGKQIGILEVDSDKGFVNFDSPDLKFGFQLTYGIWMLLDELLHNSI